MYRWGSVLGLFLAAAVVPPVQSVPLRSVQTSFLVAGPDAPASLRLLSDPACQPTQAMLLSGTDAGVIATGEGHWLPGRLVDVHWTGTAAGPLKFWFRTMFCGTIQYADRDLRRGEQLYIPKETRWIIVSAAAPAANVQVYLGEIPSW